MKITDVLYLTNPASPGFDPFARTVSLIMVTHAQGPNNDNNKFTGRFGGG
jgi:hypothetical protein